MLDQMWDIIDSNLSLKIDSAAENLRSIFFWLSFFSTIMTQSITVDPFRIATVTGEGIAGERLDQCLPPGLPGSTHLSARSFLVIVANLKLAVRR